VSIERMKTKLKVLLPEKLKDCNIDPELWLDYEEDVLDPSLKKDLGLHLQNCVSCQSSLAEFKTIRSTIQSGSELGLPSDEFFKGLNSKIMDSLDSAVGGGVHGAKWSRRLFIPLAAVAALFLLVFGGLFKTMSFKAVSSPQLTQSKLEEQFMVQAANNDPEAIAEAMISHQDVQDVVMNATAEKLSRMSDQDVARVLKAMK